MNVIVSLNKVISKFFLLLVFLFLYKTINAQNLPPDAVLKTKPGKIFKLEEKIDQIKNCKDVSTVKSTFLKEDLSEEDLPKYYSGSDLDYYVKAMQFYKQLSPKVKAVLSRDELWDVYFFDEAGVNTLLSIK